jgi:hypothetical protein
VRPSRRAPSSRVRANGGAVPRAPSRASPGAGWRPASSPNHRGTAGRAQGPDHLHTAVAALGYARRFAGQHRTNEAPAWSPDGNKIAFYDKDAINVINADRSGRKELTDTVPDLSAPAWAPDGERMAFVKRADLYVINANGSGLRRLANTTEPGISSDLSPGILPAWSPDGEKIAFPCPAAPGAAGTDLCVMNADGTEWKQISLKVASEEVPVAVSWGRG